MKKGKDKLQIKAPQKNIRSLLNFNVTVLLYEDKNSL